MAFIFTFLHFPICFTISFLLEHVVTYLNCRQETRGYSLKKHEAAFLIGQHLIFSITARSVSFVFSFLQVRFKFALTFRSRGVVAWGPWILMYPSSVLIFSQSKLIKKSRKSYPIFETLLRFNHSAPSCMK